jgi:hypothetical protein
MGLKNGKGRQKHGKSMGLKRGKAWQKHGTKAWQSMAKHGKARRQKHGTKAWQKARD